MRFEYILLLILSLLPLIYKLGYWETIFKECHYSLSELRVYLGTTEWKEKLFHFWTALEIPLFIVSFSVFISAPFEILLFNAFFYLLLLYNVFVVGKIFRKNIQYPHCSLLTLWVLLCILIDNILGLIISPLFIYLSISSILLCMPLYYIVVLYIYKRCNHYR